MTQRRKFYPRCTRKGDGQSGGCYTIITTEASPLMAPIYDRMPALLRPEEMQEFLTGGRLSFQPFAGAIAVAPCVSPMMMRRDDGAQQRDLF